jgi:tRNA U54 and U55 pseudouridine synthase Pus10
VDRRGGKPATNRLSYGTAVPESFYSVKLLTHYTVVMLDRYTLYIVAVYLSNERNIPFLKKSHTLRSCFVCLKLELQPMLECKLSCNPLKGRAIAQAVSHRLPTAAARVRAQVRSCGICGGQSDTGAGFLQVLRCSLTILIPRTAPQLSSIIRGWYHRPISGRRTKWTQQSVSPHTKKLKTR